MFRILYRNFNSYDLLKIIAIVAMVIDHIGLFFLHDWQSLRVIGRIAFPLFAFCIGYNKKYNFDVTLFLVAVIMTCVDYTLSGEHYPLTRIFSNSVLFSLLLVRLSLKHITSSLNELNFIPICIVIWCANFLFAPFVQYGTAGIMMGLSGYLIRERNIKSVNLEYFLLVNLILYSLITSKILGFSGYFFVITIVEMILIFLILRNFKIINLTVSKSLEKILLSGSRHSLLVYFLHVELFKLLNFIFL